MATDANGNTIFGHHTSWGRTRSPKNIAGSPGTAVILLGATAPLRASVAGYKIQGYATENQRYLHVLVTDAHGSGAPGAITLFGYCHAFEKWFEIGASTMDTPIAEAAANTDPTAASMQTANSGRAEADQVPSDRDYARFDILGIDRVAFVGDDDESNVYAAGSTF